VWLHDTIEKKEKNHGSSQSYFVANFHHLVVVTNKKVLWPVQRFNFKKKKKKEKGLNIAIFTGKKT
jgi:hypothetical protein